MPLNLLGSYSPQLAAGKFIFRHELCRALSVPDLVMRESLRFPIASRVCQSETKRRLVNSVETLDQKVESDQVKGEFKQID